MENFEKNVKTPSRDISIQNKKIESIANNNDTLKESLDSLFAVIQQDFTDFKQIHQLQSKVAFLFEGLMENWQKNGKTISEFRYVVETYLKLNKIPNLFYYVRPDNIGKRQPSLLESIIGTLKRLEVMEQLEVVLKEACKGIIIGGSLAYGPFYNIRDEMGGNPSSDIDTIIILDKTNESNWSNFLKCGYFAETDMKTFVSRKNTFFKSLLPDGVANIFSQKFNVKDNDFEISMHFFTEELFNSFLIGNIKNEVKGGGGDKVVTLKDFISKPFSNQNCPQKNFEGNEYNYVIPDGKVVADGLIIELPIYIINDHEFYPGFYLDLILPTFSIFYDRDGGVSGKILSFKKGIKDYIKNTYGAKNIEERIILSHMRNKIFASTLNQEIKD